MGNTRRPLTFFATPELEKQLTEAAQAMGISRSSYVVQVLEGVTHETAEQLQRQAGR
jgi:predicted HicB family RNase H-like nuclease